MYKATTSPQDRFKKFLQPLDNGCIKFTGGHTERYGMFWFNGRTIGAHIFAYMERHGEIPKGMYVCHRCDYGLCVNPDHLFLGTPQDNTRDMVRKGRNNPPVGSRQHRSKLKAADVIEIRALGSTVSQADIARLYRVTPSVISRILSRDHWKHI